MGIDFFNEGEKCRCWEGWRCWRGLFRFAGPGTVSRASVVDNDSDGGVPRFPAISRELRERIYPTSLRVSSTGLRACPVPDTLDTALG